jgi:hypothetical protein
VLNRKTWFPFCASGCSKIDSIVVLKEALGVDLGRANEIVHLSETWLDRRAADDQLQDEFWESLEN